MLPDKELQCFYVSRMLDVLLEEGLDQADPRVYAGPASAHVCKYVSWMGLPDLSSHPKGRPDRQPHLMRALGRDKHMRLMRFRLCAWDLAANRSQGRRLLPEERVCLPCVRAGRGHPIEDEKHVLLECPEHQALRDEFADRLPFETGCMREVMGVENQADLGSFISRLHDSHVLQHERCLRCMPEPPRPRRPGYLPGAVRSRLAHTMCAAPVGSRAATHAGVALHRVQHTPCRDSRCRARSAPRRRAPPRRCGYLVPKPPPRPLA